MKINEIIHVKYIEKDLTHTSCSRHVCLSNSHFASVMKLGKMRGIKMDLSFFEILLLTLRGHSLLAEKVNLFLNTL